MRKQIFIFFFILAIISLGCKKQSASEEVTPDKPSAEYHLDGSAKFLKDITISGAQKILFDSLTRTFSVTLSQNFTADDIAVKLSMYSGIQLLDSTLSATTATEVRFAYKGLEPLRFILQEPKGSKISYSVYIQAQGTPDIELLTREIPLSNGPIQLPIRIKSGLGTIPSAPLEAYPVVKITNPGSNLVLTGSFYNNQIFANVDDAGKWIATGDLSIEIRFSGGKSVTFGNVRFKRGLPRATLSGYENIISPETDLITVNGGYFIAGEKYQMRFSNDLSSQQVSVNMNFLDPLRLAGPIPKDIPEGSYLISFYENNVMTGKSSVYLSSDKTHSIETIWQGEPTLALTRNTEKISLKKGDTFYAKPWPVTVLPGSPPASAFNEKDLPLLRLKNSTGTTELKPQLVVVNWALAGFSFPIGKYMVPGNQLAGSYEATLVFPDSRESKPYWSRIEVRN